MIRSRASEERAKIFTSAAVASGREPTVRSTPSFGRLSCTTSLVGGLLTVTALYSEKAPLSGNTAENMNSSILEPEPRPCHEIPYSA
jgi:hypothetical protein